MSPLYSPTEMERMPAEQFSTLATKGDEWLALQVLGMLLVQAQHTIHVSSSKLLIY